MYSRTPNIQQSSLEWFRCKYRTGLWATFKLNMQIFSGNRLTFLCSRTATVWSLKRWRKKSKEGERTEERSLFLTHHDDVFFLFDPFLETRNDEEEWAVVDEKLALLLLGVLVRSASPSFLSYLFSLWTFWNWMKDYALLYDLSWSIDSYQKGTRSCWS